MELPSSLGAALDDVEDVNQRLRRAANMLALLGDAEKVKSIRDKRKSTR